LDLADLEECASAEVARVRISRAKLLVQLRPGNGHLWPAQFGQRVYFAGEPGVEVAGQGWAYQMAQCGHAQWDAARTDFSEEPRVELNEEGGGRAGIYGVKPEGCATGEGGVQQHACPGIDWGETLESEGGGREAPELILNVAEPAIAASTGPDLQVGEPFALGAAKAQERSILFPGKSAKVGDQVPARAAVWNPVRYRGQAACARYMKPAAAIGGEIAWSRCAGVDASPLRMGQDGLRKDPREEPDFECRLGRVELRITPDARPRWTAADLNSPLLVRDVHDMVFAGGAAAASGITILRSWRAHDSGTAGGGSMVSAEADIQDQSPESAATSDLSGGGQGTSTDRGGDAELSR